MSLLGSSAARKAGLARVLALPLLLAGCYGPGYDAGYGPDYAYGYPYPAYGYGYGYYGYGYGCGYRYDCDYHHHHHDDDGHHHGGGGMGGGGSGGGPGGGGGSGGGGPGGTPDPQVQTFQNYLRMKHADNMPPPAQDRNFPGHSNGPSGTGCPPLGCKPRG